MENLEKPTQEESVENQPEQSKEERLKGLKDWRAQVLGGIELNGGRWTREDRELVDRLDSQIKELEQ